MSTTVTELKRILYVEDDPDLRMLASFALTELAGFEVAECSSGQEALDRAEAFAPQLLLLDVIMPNMDGPTTLARLRRLPQLERTPAIFMTGKARADDIARYRALGAIHILAKPFDAMRLASEIQEAWASRPL